MSCCIVYEPRLFFHSSSSYTVSDKMEQSHDVSASHQQTGRLGLLEVDFTWRNLKALVTDTSNPDTPLYVVDIKSFKNLANFYTATDDSLFATGKIHTVKINAECTLRGRELFLKAQKRFRTVYTCPSYAFSENKDTPVTMTWTSTSDFKDWDFICLDELQQPVAKFTSHVWALKKIGHIELMGPRASDPAVREEIVVTGMTLFLCMLMRITNIFAFFGAIFHKDKHQEYKDLEPGVLGQKSEAM